MGRVSEYTTVNQVADTDKVYLAVDNTGSYLDRNVTGQIARRQIGAAGNYTTTDPGVGNDNTEGYRQGSLWYNATSNTLFVCEDATTGAAVWQSVGGTIATLDEIGNVTEGTLDALDVLAWNGSVWTSMTVGQTGAMPKSGGTWTGTQTYPNNTPLYIKKNDGTSQVAFFVSSADQFQIGDVDYAALQFVAVSTPTYFNGSNSYTLRHTGNEAALNDVSDVTITNPQNDEVLKYSGGTWVNAAAPAGASAINDLTDVTITTPSTDQVLTYNGSGWVNAAAPASDPSAQRVAVSGSRDLADSDNGKILECTGTLTLTAPSTLTANVQCSILNIGSGIVTIAAGAGSTFLPTGNVTLDNTGSDQLTFASLIHATGGNYRVLAGSKELVALSVPLSDETSALTTGTAKFTMRAPFAMVVTDVRASVSTAPVGSTIIVDINEGGVSILSTLLSIDAGEKTSTTAATPAVISDANIADDAELTFDIDQVGSGTAGAGLKVTLLGYRV